MKYLLRLIIGIYLLCPIFSQAEIIQHQISDDGYARVPLQFPFPYYGRVFTESFMFSNGVVGFINPDWNGWCCTGYNLAQTQGSPFNYAIMPLQTDLLNYQGRFLTEGTAQYQRYKWENISEFGVPNNLNTFGVEIRPSGFVGMYYEQVNISPWRPVTIGMTGDTTLGEHTQHYHGAGFSSLENVAYTTQSTGSLCLVDPLSSPSCPGYQQAYYTQQCTVNPLYDSGCQGYAEAYFNQQCRANALFDRTCPGYSEAYALVNIVATPTVVVSAPTVQVSTTGTVAVETPVVSDPVVNEVITRPTVTTNANTSTQPTTQNNIVTNSQTEPKTEKKTESKPTSTARKAEVKNEASVEAPKIVAPVHEYKAPIILDVAYMQMVKKPIKDNNRAMYRLIMNSQHKHEEMVDGQYRR
jgi:hypothetical protein